MGSTNLQLDIQSSFEIEFQRCRLRRRLGHFNEVVASLKRLQHSHGGLSADERALIIGQMAWTILLQGFFKDSYETVDLWIRTCESNSLESFVSSKTKVLLELLMEFSRVNCHGDPAKSVEMAQIIFEKELQHADHKDYNFILVRSLARKYPASFANVLSR